VSHKARGNEKVKEGKRTVSGEGTSKQGEEDITRVCALRAEIEKAKSDFIQREGKMKDGRERMTRS